MASVGRMQPYSSFWKRQEPNPVPPNQPKNTFWRHNGTKANPPLKIPDNTLDQAFDWLVHLDRPVVNGLELLQVSGYAPHRLTQKFIPQVGKKFSHRNFWEDQNSLVYRLLEMIEPTDYMDWRQASARPVPRGTGFDPVARVPGKININTIWDRQVFDALCDVQPANGFGPANVDTFWKQLILGSRTLDSVNMIPNRLDNPFKPLGVGVLDPNDAQYKGLGLDNSTLLRKNRQTGDRLGWVQPRPHPYLQYELLSKIYNNITLRSNCFAVWLTVGFFEVDEATMTIKKEIGREENRQVRHRMFAIIDRTNLLTPVPPNILSGDTFRPIRRPLARRSRKESKLATRHFRWARRNGDQWAWVST